MCIFLLIICKVDTIISQNWDREFYVCYMKTDVHENVLSEDLFEFNTESVVYGDDSWSGLRISPKSGVVLSGKVTLPSTHNGLPVISIAGFYGNTALTHVFWQSGCQLRQVNGALQTSSCFSNCSALVYFEMPETLIRISDYAFANTALMQLNFNNGLKQIGMGAFQASKSPVTSIKIPGSVENIAMQAFAFPGGTWKDITFGDIGDPTQIVAVHETAFRQSGTKAFESVTYYANTVPDERIKGLLGKLSNNTDFTVSGAQA